MNVSQRVTHLPRRMCEHCARQMTYVGKLPRVGERPTLIIYRCTECSRAAAEEA
jgi:DNA-directed RNA polymerase subunit M/transcription elongation factor TFIIS